MYEKSTDLDKIMTNKELDQALVEDYENVKKAIEYWKGCITSTHIEYNAGSTEALVWNEGEKEKTKIYLPLEDGWYLPDKKYGIPNGEKSNSSNPNARYLWRYQNDSFSGLLVRRYLDFYGGARRYVYAYYLPDFRFGVVKKEDQKTPRRKRLRGGMMTFSIKLVGRSIDKKFVFCKMCQNSHSWLNAYLTTNGQYVAVCAACRKVHKNWKIKLKVE